MPHLELNMRIRGPAASRHVLAPHTLDAFDTVNGRVDFEPAACRHETRSRTHQRRSRTHLRAAAGEALEMACQRGAAGGPLGVEATWQAWVAWRGHVASMGSLERPRGKHG